MEIIVAIIIITANIIMIMIIIVDAIMNAKVAIIIAQHFMDNSVYLQEHNSA